MPHLSLPGAGMLAFGLMMGMLPAQPCLSSTSIPASARNRVPSISSSSASRPTRMARSRMPWRPIAMQRKRAIQARAGRLPICMPMAMAWRRTIWKPSRSTARLPTRGRARFGRYGFLRQRAVGARRLLPSRISGTPVKTDLGQARQIYFQVASTFGVAEAQFQLARMMMTGEGGAANVQQAKNG